MEISRERPPELPSERVNVLDSRSREQQYRTGSHHEISESSAARFAAHLAACTYKTGRKMLLFSLPSPGHLLAISSSPVAPVFQGKLPHVTMQIIFIHVISVPVPNPGQAACSLIGLGDETPGSEKLALWNNSGQIHIRWCSWRFFSCFVVKYTLATGAQCPESK